MIKVGIDFSVTSPSICIEKDGHYEFLSFFDDGGKDYTKSKSKKYQYHNMISDIVELIPYTRNIDKSDYRSEQKTKMSSARNIARLIVDKLKEKIRNEEVIIGIEGFSYGSISSSTLDLTLYQSFLRIKLLEEFGDDCIVIISPSEGKKKFSGKGNANKDIMIQSFIENRINDSEIENNELWKFCAKNELDYKNIKPIDDLVDSFGILKSI